MVDDSNKQLDAEFDALSNSEKYHNKPNSIVSNVILLQLSSNEGDDFKALGKIKIEDLDIQETLLELEQQFDKFIIEQTGTDNIISRHGYDDVHAYSISNIVDHTEDLEIGESLLQKILGFLFDLSHSNEENLDFEYELNPLERRKKKKKKFILQAIIEYLKRLLRANRRLNLKELIDQQILELQERLSKEQDPDLRKLLQERLILLAQLKAQLIEKGISSSLIMSFLLISSLISSIIRSHEKASTSVKEKENLLNNLSKLLLLQQKDQNIVNETIASSSQSEPIVSLSSILAAQSYIADTFRGHVKEVSHKLHDQYYAIQRDNITAQHGQAVGIFAAVFAIMRAIDHAVGKVKDAIVKAFHNLDRDNEPVVHHKRDVPVKSESAVGYGHQYNCCTISQSVISSTKSTMGYLSSYSYHSEYKVTSMEIKNNSYLEEIKVKQMVQTCSISQSLK